MGFLTLRITQSRKMFRRGFNHESLTRRTVVTSKFNIKKKKKERKNPAYFTNCDEIRSTERKT